MTSWRLVVSSPLCASMNMAIDETLMERAIWRNQPIIRFYSWATPAISLGYAQTSDRHINIDRCRLKSVPVVRRLTGGKAVFHDHELTYSVTGPPDQIPFKGDLLTSYLAIAKALMRMFDRFGLTASLAAPSTRMSQVGLSSCFASASAYEILINNRKIIGSAQKRTQTGILQQGSLLLTYHESTWKDLMSRNSDTTLGHVTSLFEQLGCEVPVEHIIASLVTAFEEEFEIDLHEDSLNDSEMIRAEELASAHYPDLTL